MKRHEIVPKERLPLEWRALIAAATEARRHAYAPYSEFAVGAAIRTASGRIFTGCNVENASYGLSVCAERVAVWNAVSAGEHHFIALVIVTDSGAVPCGACRQVLSEFVTDMPILIADTAGHTWITSLRDLLPDPFPKTRLGDELETENRPPGS
ncbi:MAG: cytidine deaminase [Anaerolineae bacterium]|nr:cytidine deaminase [Anaerolineae bacterium]